MKIQTELFNRFAKDAQQHAVDFGDFNYEAGDLLLLLEYAMSMLTVDQCKKLEEYAYSGDVLPVLED